MRFILFILAACSLLWLVGFYAFLQQIPATNHAFVADKAKQTDAIVVLTGGTLRVEHGFARFHEKAAPKLFISGVGENTTLEELLLTHATDATARHARTHRHNIYLDHKARSTYANALQTKHFMQKQHVQSIRLITANYHMPRSLLEMRQAMPGVRIIADAVTPKHFLNGRWWRHAQTRNLVLQEFHKIWAVRIRHLLYQPSDIQL